MNVTKEEIKQFIKDSIEWLVDQDQGCSTLKIDDRLAICVGWLDGYDENDETVIHSSSEPSWAINVGLKVYTSDDMRTDYEFINSPYYDNGEVVSTDVSIGEDEDLDALADYFIKEYSNLEDLEIEEDGRIIEHNEDEFEDSYEDSEEVEEKDDEKSQEESLKEDSKVKASPKYRKVEVPADVASRIETAKDLSDFYAYMERFGNSPSYSWPEDEQDRIDDLMYDINYKAGEFDEENVERILGTSLEDGVETSLEDDSWYEYVHWNGMRNDYNDVDKSSDDSVLLPPYTILVYEELVHYDDEVPEEYDDDDFDENDINSCIDCAKERVKQGYFAVEIVNADGELVWKSFSRDMNSLGEDVKKEAKVKEESLKEKYTYSTAREHWGHQALDLVNEWLKDHAQAKEDIIAYIKNKNIKNEGQLEGILSCFDFDGDLMSQLKEDKKEVKESWEGESVIDDLIERAQEMYDEGGYGDIDDCVAQAIDDGLIYTDDIRALADHYGVLPDDSDLIAEFYEYLRDDVYAGVEEHEEPEEEEEEEDDWDFEDEEESSDEK